MCCQPQTGAPCIHHLQKKLIAVRHSDIAAPTGPCTLPRDGAKLKCPSLESLTSQRATISWTCHLLWSIDKRLGECPFVRTQFAIWCLHFTMSSNHVTGGDQSGVKVRKGATLHISTSALFNPRRSRRFPWLSTAAHGCSNLTMELALSRHLTTQRVLLWLLMIYPSKHRLIITNDY